ncbi:hypothetical protein NE848_15845 [Gramella jeungdoensis]|uniref:DUF4760 domain-containing protein n=1 Tax=Gramella jeungdoensis TaxID=708091 RepID=A0ABT0Z802_9FLAO|nr:hypothetical protein [Gramella jeungdoensis]MCM8570869.1 hypothetical protein [Gramella jeungdoensis]
MDNKFIITTVVTVTLAFIGYIAKYFNDLRITKRKDKLERVNRQLKELYGPLLSLTSSSDASWKQFRNTYRNYTPSYFNPNNPPSEKEKEIWRTWISTVFHPINQEIYTMVLKNGDLFIENEFPEPLRDLCAHYESYKPVIEQWKDKNYEEHLSLLNYPTDLLDYAKTSYEHLKIQQRKLID